jgi:hypothetical protein
MKLVEMPIDPRMAACLLNSSNLIILIKYIIDRDEWKVTEEILTIAALMSVQNIFHSVRDPTVIAKGKKKYGCIEGDHITLLNIYNLYNSKKTED